MNSDTVNLTTGITHGSFTTILVDSVSFPHAFFAVIVTLCVPAVNLYLALIWFVLATYWKLLSTTPSTVTVISDLFVTLVIVPVNWWVNPSWLNSDTVNLTTGGIHGCPTITSIVSESCPHSFLEVTVMLCVPFVNL